MEEFLTRRFSMSDVAWALQQTFASDFFVNSDKVAALSDMRLFDIHAEENQVCLMKDGKSKDDRRIEVTWARVDPKTRK